MADVSAALRAEVRSRAQLRCEYCLALESLTLVGHEVDHIIAVKHGGRHGCGKPGAVLHALQQA
jgi:5-methylcytosine-specific restriction endonuclease McrA